MITYLWHTFSNEWNYLKDSKIEMRLTRPRFCELDRKLQQVYIESYSMEITKYDNNINVEIVAIITIIGEKNYGCFVIIAFINCYCTPNNLYIRFIWRIRRNADKSDRYNHRLTCRFIFASWKIFHVKTYRFNVFAKTSFILGYCWSIDRFDLS